MRASSCSLAIVPGAAIAHAFERQALHCLHQTGSATVHSVVIGKGENVKTSQHKTLRQTRLDLEAMWLDGLHSCFRKRALEVSERNVCRGQDGSDMLEWIPDAVSCDLLPYATVEEDVANGNQCDGV